MDLSGSVVCVVLVTLYRVVRVCKTASPKLHPEDSSMTPAIAILTIGSEILDGRIIDTNSSFLGRTIRSRGVSVATRVACDDDLPVIVKWFQELFKAVDLIVVTGGLGPTKDDLTRDAIAAVAGVPLIEVDEEIRKLTEWYESKGRKLTDINARQAWFPQGASRIDNPVGTASGIWFELSLEGKRKAIVALPGIPKELEPMWREDVLDCPSSRGYPGA
jgi:nicotinamide-nucleotide amidase